MAVDGLLPGGRCLCNFGRGFSLSSVSFACKCMDAKLLQADICPRKMSVIVRSEL